MTPVEKKQNFWFAVALFLHFAMAYNYMHNEPEKIFNKVTRSWVDYHTYCLSNSVCCKYCLWWFVASAMLMLGSYGIIRSFWEGVHEYFERAVLTFIIIFLGIFLSDTIIALLAMSNGKPFNPKAIDGLKILLTLAGGCYAAYGFRVERAISKLSKKK